MGMHALMCSHTSTQAKNVDSFEVFLLTYMNISFELMWGPLTNRISVVIIKHFKSHSGRNFCKIMSKTKIGLIETVKCCIIAIMF